MANSFRHPDVVDVPGLLAQWWREARVAASFLTVLPVGPAPHAPHPEPDAAAPPILARAATFFPLVGTLLGLVGGLALLVVFELGLHPLACALIALAAIAALSGALHEDGLADFADGLGFGRSREQRLEIMRDSRIGTFGTLALVFGIGIRAGLLGGLPSAEAAFAALVAAATLSRVVPTAMLHWLPAARADGLAAAAGRPSRDRTLAAIAIGLLAAMVFVGFWGSFVVAIAAALGGLAVAWLARRTLGGLTGDVLGAAVVVAETAALAAAVMIA